MAAQTLLMASPPNGSLEHNEQSSHYIDHWEGKHSFFFTGLASFGQATVKQTNKQKTKTNVATKTDYREHP